MCATAATINWGQAASKASNAAPTLLKKLMDLALALQVSQTTMESARNALREPSLAQPQADASLYAAKTQSTPQQPMPASAFLATAFSQANASNVPQTTSSATDIASPALSIQPTTQKRSAVTAHLATLPTNLASALRNVEPMKSII